MLVVHCQLLRSLPTPWRKLCPARSRLKEVGRANSDLASKEDLIKRMLAKEYAIEQVEEPEADCTEANKDEGELVCLGRHPVEVG